MIDKIKSLLGMSDEEPQVVQKSGEFSDLENRLGYNFKEESLLLQALTHKSSVRPEDDPKGLQSNERLEFLGDAVVDCLVTEELFNRYPTHSEGQLSKMKSLLVSRKILGVIASRIDLDPFIIKGRSEKKNKRAKTSSVASNAFEALLGAIYKDGGIEKVRELLERVLFPSIEQFVNDVENRNYKSKILELAQADGLGIPRYPTITEEGPEHMKKFTVAIEINGVRLGTGVGKSKKEAQQEAARIAVNKYSKEAVLNAKA